MPKRRLRKSRAGHAVTLLVTANADDPYTLMIEPWGMTYELSGQERIYVDLESSAEQCPELVAWPGGFSIFVAGRAVTRDSAGRVRHEF